MLELKDVSLQLGNEPDAQQLLAELSVRFPKKHFAAILGPSLGAAARRTEDRREVRGV